jgi:DNA-binding beta-propeller fold protein YncE
MHSPALISIVFIARVFALAVGVLAMTLAAARAQSYVNFEAAQVRPICLSPDGTRLFAVNTPDGRLSVYDVSNAAYAVPVLIREIAVGVEPVSVNALTNDEAWVVNEVADSVSIVSVSAGAVVATLACKDEPGDVVFANGRAFVSCSRNNLVRVFNTSTRAEVGTIPLEGQYPRSLAVNAAGTRVYAAFKLSGNRTTLLPATLAPAQPPPTNTSLPAPPQVGLIVSADDVRLNPAPNIPDNDVAEIDTATLGVMRYFKGVGTVNFALAVRPGSTEVWVANTEARNLVRFEPAQKGHSVDNRMTRVDTAGAGTVTAFDLNPGIDYNLFPNTAALATALAQPAALAFTPDGAGLWVASFGTDRVARVSAATGAVLARIETGPTTGAAADPRNKRGPRGLALHAANQRLYVLNRITNTISIVSTASESVVAEIPAGSFDPTPAVIRQGRGFLYDARLSANGTQSCATCHIDGDRDDIAWDLGDPAGSMQTVPTLGGSVIFQMHPMKGPMTTQTFRGLPGTAPLHWRGDRASFNAFNGAFASLLGGPLLSTADMNAFTAFVNTINYEPNPNQNLDRSMPALFPPGDPNAGNPNTGRSTFLNDNYQPNLRCNTCHALPKGTNGVIIGASALLESQDFKVPHLRNAYQKLQFKGGAPAVSLSGFGLVHDGQAPDIFTFLSQPVFGTFQNDTTRKRNLAAFVQCFDTGTAPSVGYTRTMTAATLAGASADWTVLEAQATAGSSDLVVKLHDANGRRGFVYRTATNDYLPDRAALAPVTRAAIEALITSGATATVMGVPPGSGQRLGVDRDEDAVRDGDKPMPALGIASAAGTPQLAWPLPDAALVLEFTNSLTPANWQPVTHPRATSGASVQVLDPAAGPQRYYRLRQP